MTMQCALTLKAQYAALVKAKCGAIRAALGDRWPCDLPFKV